jgi:hypothetical protein
LHGFRKALLDGLGQVRRRCVRESTRDGADNRFSEFRLVAHVDAGKILAQGDLIAKRRRQQMGVGISSGYRALEL